MQDLRGEHDDSAKGLRDCLMPEADSEQRHASGKMLDRFEGDAGAVRRAWTWRDHNLLRTLRFDLCNGQLIVAIDLNISSKLTEILHEVVGKRVVVIDYEEQ